MRFAVAAPLLLLSACATPVASLHVQGAWFAPGEAVQVELRNESAFFDLEHGSAACFSHLQVEQDGAWRPAPEAERTCILLLYLTAPSSRVAFAYALDHALDPGRYRLALDVSRGRFNLFGLRLGGSGASQAVTSEPFEIRAPR